MAHEINVRSNGFAEMAFAGALPWHGLGQRVQEGASIETWQQQAGLDWSIESALVRFNVGAALATMDDRCVLYRSDTHAPLSVVSDGYRTVQPKAVLEFFRDLCDSHGFKIHTAGSLRGGRKIWAMARNGHVEEAAPGDKLRGNLLLATSCDGTMETKALWTAVRVVCANTLRIAVDNVNGRDGDAISVSHRSTFDADAVKAELGALDSAFAAMAKNAQELARKTISQAQASSLLQTLFNKPVRLATGTRTVLHRDPLGMAQNGAGSDLATLLVQPVGGAKSDAPADARSVAKVMELYNGAGMGALHAGSAGTAWGLVNAVSQYIDHSAGRSADTRMQSAWFGKGADVKDQALTLALAL